VSDDTIGMAVLEAIKKPEVHGIIGVAEIQELANLWRKQSDEVTSTSLLYVL
jgi:hypothetical protein